MSNAFAPLDEEPGESGSGRREVLRAMLALGPALFAPHVLAARATPHDVRRWGARGDGRSDDTRAFQRAIDATPPGGTLEVPAGSYLIDPTRSLRLHSRMHLHLARGARLVAMPNHAERAYVLLLERVQDVRISGGRIVGDRDRHLGRSGEWGHGIMVRGSSRVAIRDIHISRCWGDGMSVGGLPQRGYSTPSSDVEIAGVTCTGNRRQGLTIGRCQGVWVHDCEFSDTGGTAPQAGIDIEPDTARGSHDVRIERCLVRGNRGPGIQVWKRTWDVTIRDCTIEDNRNVGVLAFGATRLDIVGNHIRGNGGAAIAVRKGSNGITVRGNRFRGNGFGPPRLDRQVRIADGAHGVRVLGDNRID